MATVNVTVGMTPKMLENVDRHAEELNLSRAEYIRRCVGEHSLTRVDEPERPLEVEIDSPRKTEEGAA